MTIVFRGSIAAASKDIVQAVRDAARDRFPLLRVRQLEEDPATGGLVVDFEMGMEGERGQAHPSVAAEARASARRQAHCELMDQHRVPNGCKAISIALAEHWSDRHRERFGERASASSVKRWRAEARRRGSWGGRHRSPGGPADERPGDVARRVRLHHAIRVAAAGITMREGYEGALRDMATLAAGTNPVAGWSDRGVPPFSYTTFRRDCERLTRSSRRRR